MREVLIVSAVFLLSMVDSAGAFQAVQGAETVPQRWPNLNVEVRGSSSTEQFRRRILDDFQRHWRSQECALFGSSSKIYPHSVRIVAEINEAVCRGTC